MEANVAPYQTAVLARDARSLRIAVVSHVRFVREGLAEILKRDPLVSVVRVCADLSEVVAESPAPEADVILLEAAQRKGRPFYCRRSPTLVRGEEAVSE